MLKVHTKNLGAIAILCLQGRIVRGQFATLRNAVYSQSGVSAVVLDLTRVTTIDAGGLGMMLELRAHAESRGIAFKLVNVTKRVSRLFEITRLDTVFEITSGADLLSAGSYGQAASVLQLPACA